MLSSVLWLAAAAAYGPPVPATEPVTAEQAVEAADRYYSVAPPPVLPCPESTEEHIIVCPDTVKMYSRDFVRTSTGGPNDAPQAPGLEPHYPGVMVARGCFIPPCPRKMPVLIDLKAIP